MGYYKWRVRGYASKKHPAWPIIKEGDLLVETMHHTVASKNAAIHSWRERIAKGDVSHYEVTDLENHKTEIYYG